LDKIKQNTLHGEVAARIRDMIDQGVLPPGSRVPEKQLCEQFGVSRTPLREALKVLAFEGFVELMPNRGSRVVKLTKASLRNTFEVMQALEALAGERACERINEAEFENIEMLHKLMLSHYKSGDMQQYLLVNQQIHEAIVEASKNDVLINVYKNLNQRVRHVRFTAEISTSYWSRAIKDHEIMVDALRDRDSLALGDVLRRHLRDKVEVSAIAQMAD